MSSKHRLWDKRICLALQRADDVTLDAFAREMMDRQLLRDSFDGEGFDALIEVLDSPTAVQVEGAWRLLTPLQLDAEKLTLNQRQQLLPALEHAYHHFVGMNRFFLSELIGELFSDESGLAAAIRLIEMPEPEARALVSHILEHVVAGSKDPLIRTAGIQRLRSMNDDPAAVVRAELVLAVQRLFSHLSDAERPLLQDLLADLPNKGRPLAVD